MREHLKDFRGSITEYKIVKESFAKVKDYSGMNNMEFNIMVEEDIRNIRNATGLSEKQAIDMAKNFLLRYPALMEYARIICEPSMIPQPKKKTIPNKVVSITDIRLNK